MSFDEAQPGGQEPAWSRAEAAHEGDEVILDLTHGVSLDLRQFEATRNSDRPEYDYVDHSADFRAADSFGIHIPEAAMQAGREFPVTTNRTIGDLNVDDSWLRRLTPFKR